MRVVVLYESRSGHTRQAAELIGGVVEERGHDVAVYSIGGFDYSHLARADAVFIGTWCDGAILFGQRPGAGRRIDRRLPVLDGKPAGVFLTYAINPGKGLRKLDRLVRTKGADVVAGCTFRSDRLQPGEPFERLVDAVIS